MLASIFSLNIGAWESNDEADHVSYVEYVVRTGHRPPVKPGHGVEVHQGPLYYYLVAGWQKALGIQPFDPVLIPAPSAAPLQGRHQLLQHPSHGPQHEQAKRLHVLRFVSVAAGACTVALSFTIGWSVSRSRKIAAAIAATVALWPRFLVVNACVTNTSLAITMCAATVAAGLWWRQKGSTWSALASGAAGGAAVLTQVTSLPIVALVLGTAAISRLRQRDLRGPCLALLVLTSVCGWWFVSNMLHYGDPLASAATNAMLRHYFGDALVRPHLTFAWDVLGWSCQQLAESLWYQGGWNQLMLPRMMSYTIDTLAVISCALYFFVRRQVSTTLALTALGSLLSWLALSTTTTQATGRYLLIGAPAWAGALVCGAARCLPARALAITAWPAAFLALDGYVLSTEVLRYPAF